MVKNISMLGVMVIDLDKVVDENIFNNLISTVLKLNSRIIQWDQDVLNKYFDLKF